MRKIFDQLVGAFRQFLKQRDHLLLLVQCGDSDVALVLKALHGLQRCGAHRVHLEVTAQNGSAVRIYRRLGFRCRKTLYKAVDAVGSLRDSPRTYEWLD